ncbi:MAG: hypothetical protein JRJ58_04665 [Deltaproteobacteria bacterium]|nr:hypothetical protein [Deltaproteobacteria bacterium]
MAIRYEMLPIPAIPRYTRIFEAGCVSIGVEYRLLNEQLIREEYGDDARALFGNVMPDALQGVIDEDGVAVHVFGSEDEQEYLRFDCFADFPHYHYLVPHEGHQTVIEFDPVANGPMIPWALECLGSRLAEMLTHTGAAQLAKQVDRDVVEKVLVEVSREVEATIKRGKPTLVADA